MPPPFESMVLPPISGTRTREPYPDSDKTARKGGCCHGMADSCVVRFPGGGVATAMGRSEGFTKLVPSIIVVVGCAASMFGLAMAMKSLPVGTAYAVWVGIGAVVTVAYAMITGAEPVSVAKILLLGGIVGCVIGLKLVE